MATYVLRPAVPLRRLLLKSPFALQARLASHGALLRGVSRELATAVQNFSQRQFELWEVRAAKIGSITAVQRSSSNRRLNPHDHLIGLDGVCTESNPDEAPARHPLPHLGSLDGAERIQGARVRTLRFAKRHSGIVETQPLVHREGTLAEQLVHLQSLHGRIDGAQTHRLRAFAPFD